MDYNKEMEIRREEDEAELIKFLMSLEIEEVKKVENGTFDKTDNPLKNAPHTAQSLICGDWNHSYSREVAAYPAPWTAETPGDFASLSWLCS